MEQEEEISESAAKQRRYYKNNREAWNNYQREYKKRRYSEDPVYRLKIKEYQRERRKSKKAAEEC